MSVITDGFKIGSITLSSKYCKTKAEITALASATDLSSYPDVFPIWCTDDDSLYIMYKSTNGTATITNIDDVAASTSVMIYYPTLNTTTNVLSWALKELQGTTTPDPVTLVGKQGASAYDVWVARGNTGTEDDFLASLRWKFDELTDTELTTLKTSLGLDTALTTMNTLIDKINNGS